MAVQLLLLASALVPIIAPAIARYTAPPPAGTTPLTDAWNPLPALTLPTRTRPIMRPIRAATAPPPA